LRLLYILWPCSRVGSGRRVTVIGRDRWRCVREGCMCGGQVRGSSCRDLFTTNTARDRQWRWWLLWRYFVVRYKNSVGKKSGKKKTEWNPRRTAKNITRVGGIGRVVSSRPPNCPCSAVRAKTIRPRPATTATTITTPRRPVVSMKHYIIIIIFIITVIPRPSH